ncbi:unnamed protein product, partial [Cyprideis torosa]
ALHFDEGDTVQQGDLVAELDAQPYREAFAVAQANVMQARAQLDKLRSGSRPQEIAQAQQAVTQAQAAFRNADNEYKRQSKLADSGVISRSLLDAARSAHDQAAAVLSSARQALALKQEGSRAEDISAGEAGLAAAQAALAQAQTALDDTRLRSPANGVVLTRVREPGSMLGSGSPVYSLSLNDP